MATKIAVHSFKGGTGKSTISANIAVSLALAGRKVGVLDLDLAGPGLHVLFEMKPDSIKFTLNDYFLGRCGATDIAIDLTDQLHLKQGKLLFVPASFKAEDIVRVLSRGYEIGMFKNAIEEISKMHEQFHFGNATSLLEEFGKYPEKVKGEIVVIISAK